MPDGLFALRKLGLASFCSPAKQKVKPRKARSGKIDHPKRVLACGGRANVAATLGLVVRDQVGCALR
jgi:hypothetical protein